MPYPAHGCTQYREPVGRWLTKTRLSIRSQAATMGALILGRGRGVGAYRVLFG